MPPTSPLTAYYYNDTSVTSQYVARVGAQRVIFGVPYYGRKACVGSAVANAFPLSSVVADGSTPHTYTITVWDASGSIVAQASATLTITP